MVVYSTRYLQYIVEVNYWYKNGNLHRNSDLPAIEWYKNGIEFYPINQLICINMIKIKILVYKFMI